MKYLFLIAALLPLTACSNPAQKVVVRENPRPQEPYMIELDASQAPGEIQAEQVNASVGYQTQSYTPECTPKTPPLMEWRMSDKRLTIPMSKVGPNRFQGVVYLDAIQSEDYFKKGLCAWHLNAASAGFVGKGGLGFGLGLGYPEFKPGGTSTAYYLVKEFSEPVGDRPYSFAFSVPTNDFTKDPENSYVNDKTKYFPIYLKVEPLVGSSGLSVKEEFEKRTGKKIQ